MPTSNSNAAPTDVDFIIGHGSVRHRRLYARLAGDVDWTELSGVSLARKSLGGIDNVEDNVLLFPTWRYAPPPYARSTRTLERTQYGGLMAARRTT